MKSGPSFKPNTQISSQASSVSARLKLLISLSGGGTLVLALPSQFEEWERRRPDPGFQAQIRGLLLTLDGRSYALTAPRAFRRVLYNVEIVPGPSPGCGENVPPAAIRASYAADAVLASMTLHLKGEPPMVRFDVRLAGKLRWAP